MFPDFDYAERIRRARGSMRGLDLDVLLLSVGADLPYLTGYQAMESERLTMLVLPSEGDATLVVPALERPRVTGRSSAFEIRPWGEHEDPVAIVADLAGPARRAAVGERTWARFLLALQEAMPGVRFTSAAPLLAEMRVRKDGEELEWLGRAARAADRVVSRLIGERFSGRSEIDLAREVTDLIVEEGHDSAEFAIVASGPNGASPHHEPGDRVIEPGDAVVVDLGGRMGGYCSDTTRTFHVGEPSPGFASLYEILCRAQAAAVDAAAPGVPAQEVDRTARGIISGAGYGDHFLHRTGHGIGLEVHEETYIIEGNERPLEPGMVFSVEPGIYVEGEFGMRIEDIVVVTEDGRKRLNRSSRDLHLVD